MKSVLISIRPQWCELIVTGKKTVEIRKSSPKTLEPFRCYIYQTKTRWAYEFLRKLALEDLAERLAQGRGKVIGEFICDQCIAYDPTNIIEAAELSIKSLVMIGDIRQYAKGKKEIYGLHISKLKIYDEPRPLTNYQFPCPNDLYCESCAMYQEHYHVCGNYALQVKKPPQSWFYVEDNT